MRMIKLSEFGCEEALLGLGLSFNKTKGIDSIDQLMPEDQEALLHRAYKLAPLGNGHNNFLCQIITWWKVSFPFYFLKQLDRYRFGKEQQSASTMHTLINEPIIQEDFEKPIVSRYLKHLNDLRENNELEQLVNDLPSGYLQERVISFSYMSLLNIVNQRKNHKLKEWKYVINSILDEVNHPQFLIKGE